MESLAEQKKPPTIKMKRAAAKKCGVAIFLTQQIIIAVNLIDRKKIGLSSERECCVCILRATCIMSQINPLSHKIMLLKHLNFCTIMKSLKKNRFLYSQI